MKKLCTNKKKAGDTTFQFPLWPTENGQKRRRLKRLFLHAIRLHKQHLSCVDVAFLHPPLSIHNGRCQGTTSCQLKAFDLHCFHIFLFCAMVRVSVPLSSPQRKKKPS